MQVNIKRDLLTPGLDYPMGVMGTGPGKRLKISHNSVYALFILPGASLARAHGGVDTKQRLLNK